MFDLFQHALLLLKLIELASSSAHTAEIEPAESALCSVSLEVERAITAQLRWQAVPAEQDLQELQTCILLVSVLTSVQKKLLKDDEMSQQTAGGHTGTSRLLLMCWKLELTLMSMHHEIIACEIVKKGKHPQRPLHAC